MLSDTPPPETPPSLGLIERLSAKLVGRPLNKLPASVMQAATDPLLPWLILGVIGAAFFAAFVLHAPSEIVVDLLLVGCVTAILEIKTRNNKGGG